MSDLLLAADHYHHHDPEMSPVFSPAEGYSPRHVWEDTISRSVAEVTQEQLWNGLSSLYNSNEGMKEDAAEMYLSSNRGELDGEPTSAEILDNLLETFMNGANKVLDELTIIGNSHPILAIAIFAFHEVIKLDLARRDNNKKVLVVVLEMQNMLGPMFQLRNLNHKHMPAHERQFHENRLKELVEVITQDIKVCRSDITHFMNRKFVYKLVLAKGYERKFATHIETFLRRRSELQAVISEYVAIGISSANIALAEIGRKVDIADDKLDRITAVLFRNLDTPRERDVFKFMQQHGGPEKCVSDLDILPKLISKAGQSPKTGKISVSNRAELEDLRKELSEALDEDLDKVLDKHFLRFEKVLQVQNNNMKRMASHLENQGYLMQTQSSKLGQILDTVTTIMVLEEGKYRAKAVKLKDPEIHRVWTQMNLTSVVKAKVFVLTFRDHIRLDRSTAATPTPSVVSLHEEDSSFQSFLSPTQSIHSDNNHPLIRPAMTLTESTRDFHTLQLAMNSIDAEEASDFLQSSMESSHLESDIQTIEIDTIIADTDVDTENVLDTPKPSLRLTVTDTDPEAFQPLMDMPKARPYPQEPQATMISRSGKESDEWVLEYIDAAYVKPIVEAMDEDGSGFISASEANRFALARPDGMNLLHWIAYWAAGWHINITKYQKDIYTVLLQISDIAPHVLVTNRAYIDDYLDVPVLTRVDALLRSIRAAPENARKDQNLIEVANTLASLQIDRLKTNLSDMGHIIESGLDATTIAGGSRRVETWILPLLLLLLQRHQEVIRLAKTVVLDPREFDAHVQSLVSVFSVFDERMENLEAKFRQLHSDIDAQFHNFSYGMFFAAFKKNEFSTSDHTLLSKVREYWRSDDSITRPGIKPDVSILSMPVGETFNPDDPILEPTNPSPDNHVPHPMEGAWSGWFQPWEGIPNYIRPHRCVIHPIINNKFIGKAEAFCGRVDMPGFVEPLEPGSSSSSADLKIHFDFIPEYGRYGQQCCWGTYNAEKDVIEGTYTWSTAIRPMEPTAMPPPIFYDGNEANLGAGPINGGGSVANDSVADGAFGWGHPAGESTASAAPDQLTAVDGPADDVIIDSKPEGISGENATSIQSVQQVLDDATPSRDFKETAQSLEAAQMGSVDLGGQVYPYRASVPVRTHEEPTESVDGRKGDGRFILTRAPIHLLRYRYLLDGSGTPPCWNVWPLARKRWAYAIEAVLADTRIRMNSGKVFRQSLIDRRKWIYFGIRWYLTNPAMDSARGWYPYEPLTPQEWELYDALESYVPPTNSRLYEMIAGYLARREAHIVPVGRLICDVCSWVISFDRHQCIYCKDDDLLTDHGDVDVCYNCIDKPVPFREFCHSKSHSLLRSPHRIHKWEFKNIIPEARFISERCKKMFRAQEERRNETSKNNSRRNGKGKGARNGRRLEDKQEPSPDSAPIYCSCCAKVLSLPCWVCIVCSPYVFICSSCERTNASCTNWAAFYHSKREHQIIRIYDSVEVKNFPGSEGHDVGRQLEEINTTISSLEKKINKQLEEGQETKGVVDEMAKKVGISWTDGYSTSMGDVEEADYPSSYKAIEAGDLVKDIEISVPVDAENTPVRYEPSSTAGTYLGESSLDIERRLDALEAKFEARINSLEAKMDGNMGALDAKVDALLTLVQSLVSSSSSTVDSSNGS